jgi:hypothetical protein
MITLQVGDDVYGISRANSDRPIEDRSIKLVVIKSYQSIDIHHERGSIIITFIINSKCSYKVFVKSEEYLNYILRQEIRDEKIDKVLVK